MEPRRDVSALAIPAPGFPRSITIAGRSLSAYKVFLATGICVGTFMAAAVAASSGLSPLRIGLAAMVSALAGLIGARAYHVLLHARAYVKSGSLRAVWDTSTGGLGVFGALLTFVPVSLAMAAVIGVSPAALWDDMALGVLAGGFWIRLGCVFNGCCAGRETAGPFGVRLHDTQGVTRRRIPVQVLEMAWWILGLAVFLSLWPKGLPTGGFALGVLVWYGAGRFCLEPLRERPDIVWGRMRINQLVAAVVLLSASAMLIFLLRP